MARQRKYSDEMLRDAMALSKTWAETCRRLGVKPATGSQTYMKKRADLASISAGHFLGQAANKGKTFKKKPLDQYLCLGSSIKSHDLRCRLIRDGLKEKKCEGCGLDKWRGKEIPLELEHNNGDHSDNRIENLSILCPNCHAITLTYCKRKARVVELADTPVLDAGRWEFKSPLAHQP
jgi:hypothetical protein